MYKLSELADEDIFKIAYYTIQQFGKHQAKLYHNKLENVFRLLAESPRMVSNVNGYAQECAVWNSRDTLSTIR